MPPARATGDSASSAAGAEHASKRRSKRAVVARPRHGPGLAAAATVRHAQPGGGHVVPGRPAPRRRSPLAAAGAPPATGLSPAYEHGQAVRAVAAVAEAREAVELRARDRRRRTSRRRGRRGRATACRRSSSGVTLTAAPGAADRPRSRSSRRRRRSRGAGRRGGRTPKPKHRATARRSPRSRRAGRRSARTSIVRTTRARRRQQQDEPEDVGEKAGRQQQRAAEDDERAVDDLAARHAALGERGVEAHPGRAALRAHERGAEHRVERSAARSSAGPRSPGRSG